MITNEEARKAIEKYQKEHPLPFGTIDVTAISSKEGADIISQTIEKISKQIDKDTELWCICEMAKMYMQGVRPVYPVRPQGKWIITSEDADGIHHIKCPFCKYEKGSEFEPYIIVVFDKLPYFCENCGAYMREEKRDEQTTD